jgi:hypothetical protein
MPCPPEVHSTWKGKTLPPVRHAVEPTHDGAEARITIPTRSCAPSHFVTLADGSRLVFVLASCMFVVAVCFSDC